MERNYEAVSSDEASEALAALADDRGRLASSIRTPWGLMAAFGAMAAWWVGTAAGTTPGANYEAPQSGWFALVGVLIVLHLVHRESGVSFRKMGATATWLVAAIIVSCLVLFSVSLGLVSLDLRWAVIITSLIAFAITTWLSALAFRAAVRNAQHG